MKSFNSGSLATIIFFYLFIALCHGFNSNNYTSSIVMEPFDYTVYWRVDLPDNALYLALRVKTTGWVCVFLF